MKRKGRGKYLGAAVALVAGVTVLTASVFANYDNANGYSVVKDAAKNTFVQQVLNEDTANVTLDSMFEISVDGQTVGKVTANAKLSNDRDDVRQSSTMTTDMFGSTMLEKSNWQDGSRIYQNTYSDGTVRNSMYQDSGYNRVSKTQEQEDMEQKMVKFAETIGDALIGDVKNYFVLADDNGSERTYTVSLSGSQLPEYVTAGMSLLTAGIRESVDAEVASYEGATPEESLMLSTLQSVLNSKVDPKIETANAKIRVNNDNFISGVYGDVTFSGVDESGARHELKVVTNAELYDYGTTVADRVDVNSIPNLEVISTSYLNSAELHSNVDEDGNVSYSYTDGDGNVITTNDIEGSIATFNGSEKEQQHIISDKAEDTEDADE